LESLLTADDATEILFDVVKNHHWIYEFIRFFLHCKIETGQMGVFHGLRALIEDGIGKAK
jgi:hypothetical protein